MARRWRKRWRRCVVHVEGAHCQSCPNGKWLGLYKLAPSGAKDDRKRDVSHALEVSVQPGDEIVLVPDAGLWL